MYVCVFSFGGLVLCMSLWAQGRQRVQWLGGYHFCLATLGGHPVPKSLYGFSSILQRPAAKVFWLLSKTLVHKVETLDCKLFEGLMGMCIAKYRH